MKTITNNLLKFGAFAFALTGLIVLVVFFCKIYGIYTVFSSEIKMDVTGQIGDFIGGIVGTLWSFAGMLLFYLSLKLQRESIEKQGSQWNQQRTEDNYFKLLEYHFKIEFKDQTIKRNISIHWITERIRSNISNAKREITEYRSIVMLLLFNNDLDDTFRQIPKSLYFIIKFLYHPNNTGSEDLVNHLSSVISEDEKCLLFYYLLAKPDYLTTLGDRYLKSEMIPHSKISFDVRHPLAPHIFPLTNLKFSDEYGK